MRLILEPDPELYSATKNVMNCVNEAAGTEIIVLGVGVNATRVRYLDDADPDVCGSWVDDESMINLDPNQWGCPTGIVLVHEAGHAMGFWHNLTDPSDVMYPRVTPMTMSHACASLITHFAYDAHYAAQKHYN